MRILGAMLAVAVVGCGVSDSSVTENAPDVLEDGAELSASSRTYVALRHDDRRCISPLCGGYWVRDLNRATPTEKYVSGLDFTGSGLGAAEEAIVREGLGEVVLRGKLGPVEAQFGTRTFVVSEAWRGMPGKAVAAGDSFFKLSTATVQCIRAPCPSYRAVRGNFTAQTYFHALELDRAAAGRLDLAWLEKRATQDGALTAGALVRSGEVLTLEASNVFVKLPEAAGPCPLVKQPPCASGMSRTFVRNEDRCIVSSQCVAQGVCTQLVPTCGEGTTRVTWASAPRACPQMVCEPSWLHATP
jgi:hypothetical protein